MRASSSVRLAAPLLLAAALPCLAGQQKTEVRPVTDVLHGRSIVDPQRGLEGDEKGNPTPEATAQSDAPPPPRPERARRQGPRDRLLVPAGPGREAPRFRVAGGGAAAQGARSGVVRRRPSPRAATPASAARKTPERVRPATTQASR